MFKRILFSAVFLVFANQVRADALEDFRLFQKQVTRGRGSFEQVVAAPSGKIKQRGQGTFAFEKPGKFRWDIQKPFPQLIVADGTYLYTYDPDLEQATQRDVKTALGQSPAALLFGQADIDTLFNVVSGEKSGDMQWLIAKPKAEDSLFSKIKLGMKSGSPAAIEVTDSLGQITSITLSAWRTEESLPASLFRFDAPAGVDIIRSP